MKKSFYTISTIMIFAVFIAACAPQRPSAAPAPAITAPPTQAVQVEELTVETPAEQPASEHHGERLYLPDMTFPVLPVIEPVDPATGLFKVPMPRAIPEQACPSGTPEAGKEFQYFSRIQGEEWLWFERFVDNAWEQTTGALGARLTADSIDGQYVYWVNAYDQQYRADYINFVTCNGAPPAPRYVALDECETGIGAYVHEPYTWYNPDVSKGVYHMEGTVMEATDFGEMGEPFPINNFAVIATMGKTGIALNGSYKKEDLFYGLTSYFPTGDWEADANNPSRHFLLPLEAKCRPLMP